MRTRFLILIVCVAIYNITVISDVVVISIFVFLCYCCFNIFKLTFVPNPRRIRCTQKDNKSKHQYPHTYIVHEGAVARLERVIKRMWVLVLSLIILLFVSNAAWIWYESQFEEIRIEQDNESGYNNFIGNDGDIHNGETDNNNP